MTTLVIHTHALNFEQSNIFGRSIGKPTKHSQHYRIETDKDISPQQLISLREQTQCDVNIMPANFDPSRLKLVISDMDSTLIAIECIDEIADMLGVKPEVAAITEAAMQGDLNFEESLTQRVQLLKGLNPSALEQVYQERLTLNPGAEKWIAGLKAADIKFALVSGGFTFFTDRLKQRLDLDFAHANVLKVENNQLAGEVIGSIVGAQAKADYLQVLCNQLDITLDQTIAVGDGANDLAMMKIAGLSIAYHAKPTVQQQADCALNYRGLDAILDFIV